MIPDAIIAIIATAVGAAGSYWIQQLSRRQEREIARQSRESEITPDAYALRRQLRSWHRDSHAGTSSVKGAEEWARTVSRHFDAAEEKARRIAAAAADISSSRATAARRAYLLFYEAADLLNSAAAGDVLVFADPANVNADYGCPAFAD